MAKPSIPRKIAENELLKIIKENQPISIYNLRKLTGYLSYSGIHQYIDELERKDKIKTELKIGENNRTERIIMVKEKENEK
ncbi:unnamed protein product [marine sediment metagenome]|uniref:LexA repressor DNA-binding domain-containing protein n=1 Tax=marine sediment metagenome TaxID=412755 RepID=X1IWD4_9ZZZZ